MQLLRQFLIQGEEITQRPPIGNVNNLQDWQNNVRILSERIADRAKQFCNGCAHHSLSHHLQQTQKTGRLNDAGIREKYSAISNSFTGISKTLLCIHNADSGKIPSYANKLRN